MVLLWHEMKLEKESTTKQSTTSVIDFEERLSSVCKEPEPSPDSALETLSIKQKIEMFSRESEKNDRNKNPPQQPVKPQIRVNSEPIFEIKMISDANKINSSSRKLTAHCVDNKKSVDSPVTCNKKPIDFPVTCNKKPIDPPVTCNKKPIDPPVTCNKKPIDPPVTCNKKPIDPPVACNKKPIDPPVSCNNKPVEPSLVCSKKLADPPVPCNKKPVDPPFVSTKMLIEPPVTLEKREEKDMSDDRKLFHEKSENITQENFLVDTSPEKHKLEILISPKIPRSEIISEKHQTIENNSPVRIIGSSESVSSSKYSPDKLTENFPLVPPAVPREKNIEPFSVENEEHGKVVQTINRHLLMNKLSDDSDVLDYPCFKPKSPDCSSNSLPHHGKVRMDSYERKTTHSLPTRGRAECDSELSRTISKVITEERERTTSGRGKVVKNKEHKPLTKTSQSIFYSKSYSSESLDKSCEGRSRQESEFAYKYNSLEERHIRRESGGDLRGPPVPPPRPSLSKPSNACYRAAMIAAHHLIGKASPKAHRKKQHLAAKGRNVAVKDFPSVEVDGWLVQRCRKGSGTWNKRWCLIHANTLYIFTSRQASKAETMVCLPGFTAAPAEEVKSRPYAFKVYHTGTMFYFAAETNFELSVWLDAITTSTLGPNPNTQAVVYSESEGEESPVRKAPTPAPRPPSGSGDSGGHMFGSLKKLGSGGSSSGSGGSSLDRKCLRILGPGPVPVPTAHYRSYRRVHNVPPPPPPSNSVDHGSDMDPPPTDMADYRLTSHSTPPVPRRRTVVREDNWSTPVRPVPPTYDERVRRIPDPVPLPASIPLTHSAWEGAEHSPDPFSKPPSSRKKIKMKKPHLGGGVRGVFPNPQPLNRHPLRTSQQDAVLGHQAATDYPGLEYPPVFEPGTYTLDTSSLLMARQHQPPS